MRLKRLISAGLITTLFPSAMGTTALGAENSTEGAPDLEIIEAEAEESGGIIHFDYGTDDSVLLKSYDNGIALASEDSGSSYNTDLSNLKYVTEPKDQGSLGTCWAFSATSCLETLLMKRDNSTDASSGKYNFSELHAALALSNKFLQDDTYGLTGYEYDGGGNGLMYAMYTTRAAGSNIFTGPVLESDMSYITDSSEIALIDSYDMDIEPTDYFPGTFSSIELSGELEDTEKANRNTILKEMVDSYGSVSVSIYGGESSTSSYENFKQTNDYTLFYQSSPATTNHAVTIVGYDDAFDADIFKDAGYDTPSMDGAFIVKNSWGTGWGKNNGFFYMSYASYLDTIYAYGDLISRDSYDYEYDYTPYMPTGTISGNSGVFANYFEKQTEAGEKLNKISVYVQSPETTLKIYVDSVLSDGKVNDFQLVSVESGSGYETSDNGTTIKVPYVGNYVFELSNPIEIDGGFTVAVYAESDNGAPVAFEHTNDSIGVNHKFINNSYYTSNMNSTFYNVYEVYNLEINFMIRAYTEELPVTVIVNNEFAYSTAYGTRLEDALMDFDYAAAQGALFEAVENEGNTYRPADKDMELTADETRVYTGEYIYAPTINMVKYQADEENGQIRFVAEITDSFYDNVAEVADLGFYYSKDGGSINDIISDHDLYKSLGGDYTADDGVYLFKSDPLEEGNYTVYAFVKYWIGNYDELYTVYTSEQTITAE